MKIFYFIFSCIIILNFFIDNSLSLLSTSSSTPNLLLPYDYIVVGSGVAGSILAYRLSQTGKSVLVIEGGGKSIGAVGGNDYIGTKGTIDPNTNIYTPQRPLTKYDVPFYFQSASISGNRWDIQGANVAKMVGGSGLHNAMVFQRGIESDYSWGIPNWNNFTNDYLRYFTKIEKILEPSLQNSTNHGTNGFIQVRTMPFDKEGSDFIDSAMASGLPYNSDFQSGPRQGVGYFQLNIDENGERCSTAHQYLVRALQNPNVALLDSSTVTRIKWAFNIITGKNEAIGVEYFSNSSPSIIRTLFCNKEVILAAGALNTPKILMHSGVGDVNVLSQAKYSNFITPIKHLPGVGLNLQDHSLVYNLWSYANYSTRPDIYNMFTINLQYSTAGAGVLATPGFSVGAWLKPNASSVNADAIMTIVPGALGAPSPGMMSVAVSLCEPTPSPLDFVTLNDNTTGPAYLFYSRGVKMTFDPTRANQDVKKIVNSIKETRRIMSYPPMSNLATPINPSADIDTDEELEQWVTQNIIIHDHYIGTTKLGLASDPNAVVDPNLRVIGLNRVRVVDASIFPKMPHGLLQASVMAIAEKCADIIINGS